MAGGTTESRRWSNIAFGALFATAFLLVGRVVWPFVVPVLLAGFLVVLMMPLHDALCRVAGRGVLSAALSTVLTFAVVCVPVAGVVWLVGGELVGAAARVQAMLGGGDLGEALAARVPRSLARLVPALEGTVPAALSRGAQLLSGLVVAGGGLALDLLLMAIALYYFFLDGRRLVRELGRLLPLDERYFMAFVAEVKGVTRAILYGSSLTALAQAVVGLLGLWLSGVPHPLVWAAVMALTAMIPIGGTALVWAPLGLALIAAGRPAAGAFLLAWGLVVVGSVDSLLRPRLTGSRMAVHPLLVFISLFGGLAAFGVVGLLVGPLACALFMSMVRIYRRDFLGAGAGGPAPAAPEAPLQARPRPEPLI
ncbi:MAG: AI-2E family transporter [Myxococcaceae bacterium]